MGEQPHAADGEFQPDKDKGHEETAEEKKKREDDEHEAKRKKTPEHR